MAVCSPARAPISSISLSAGIKRPFDFIISDSFTWKQELDGKNLSNLFSLGWSPLNPSGGGRTSPLGAETKISETCHSEEHLAQCQELCKGSRNVTLLLFPVVCSPASGYLRCLPSNSSTDKSSREKSHYKTLPTAVS